MPIHWRNCSLPGIDLHKRSRTNNRVPRVILHPDVTVKGIVPVHLLRQCVGNIFPIFDYLRHEVGSFGLQPLPEFEGRPDREISEFRSNSNLSHLLPGEPETLKGHPGGMADGDSRGGAIDKKSK